MTAPLCVLEVGTGVASAYAAKLLGDYGADVVKVEPPDGDPSRRRGPFPDATHGAGEADAAAGHERSGVYLALNVNKRGVAFDYGSEHGRSALASLLDWADVLVHDHSHHDVQRLGLDPATLEAEHPALVTLSITPFGATGPYRDLRASELIVANAGGWTSLTPGTHEDPALPPLKVSGSQCAMMSGTAGALVALAAARQARQSGVGEFIDFSQQEYVASVLEAGIPVYSYMGAVLKRFHPRGLVPWRTFEARDGALFLCCIEQDQWQRLVKFMGEPEWARLEVFAEGAARAENRDLLHQFMQEFIGEWNAFDLYHAAQKRRICFAPVMDYAQVSASEHLRARGFFVTVRQPGLGAVEHLAPVALGNGGRAPIRRPAPRLGEHNDLLRELRPSGGEKARGAVPGRGGAPPLDGVRVVDLSWVWAGTFCAMNLAHLGAEVVRFESEKRPDLYRRAGMRPPHAPAGLDSSGMFNQWNQGKKSVAVDLGSVDGVAVVKDFVRISDVVVQNFATGVLERLGLGYEVLREINPRIVLASISGYGQTGPYRNYMGYGPATSPLTGVAATTGYPGGGPEEVGVSMPDPNAGITAALAVVGALERRDLSGEGDHLDVSLVEASAAFGVEGWMQFALTGEQAGRIGNRDPHMAPHGCFPCRSEEAREGEAADEWVAIACADDAQWRALAALMEPALARDPRFATLAARKAREEELEALVADWTRGQDRWQVTNRLQSAGIAAFPTFSCRDILEDPHLNARGYIERLPHPVVGARAHVGIPWRLRRRPSGVRKAAPCLGADTDAELRATLGYSESRIAELRARDVLR